MSRITTATITRNALAGSAIALALSLVVVACGTTGAANPSATPGESPVASPSAPAQPSAQPSPTPVPTPVITPKPDKPVVTPGPDGVDGAHFPLDVPNGDVTLDIADPDGYLVDATSGTAKDGMSVRWGTAQVRNLDDRTIEVTWVGLPGDEAVTLVVRPAAGDGLILRFGQDAPPANSDAMGADRVVVLTFANPIAAERIVTDFTTADD
ncbi:MAG TPA: hypothetical protein VFY23_01995 [Candidatus Limnocylindrales bacterium]|nr:hypothetical protein [Candidatus Limnocylindrales bacterium]